MNSTVQLVFLIVLSVLIVGCIIGIIIISRQNAFLQEQIDQLDDGLALDRENFRVKEESGKKKKASGDSSKGKNKKNKLSTQTNKKKKKTTNNDKSKKMNKKK